MRGERVLPAPIASYGPETLDFWEVTARLIAFEREEPPSDLNAAQADEWMHAWTQRIARFDAAMLEWREKSAMLDYSDAEIRLFGALTAIAVLEQYMTLISPGPDPYPAPGRRAEVEAQLAPSFRTTRNGLDSLYEACIDVAQAATLSAWGARCADMREQLAGATPGPTLVEVPDECREPVHPDLADAAYNYAEHPEQEPAYVVLITDANGLAPQDQTRVLLHASTMLRQRGVNILTMAEVEASAEVSLQAQCRLEADPLRELAKTRPVGTILLVVREDQLLAAALPLGRVESPGFIVHIAPFQGQTTEFQSWINAVNLLQPATQGMWQGVGSFADVFELLMGSTATSAARIAVKVTREVLATQPRSALLGEEVTAAIAACLGEPAREFAMLELEIGVSASGAVERVVSHSAGEMLAPNQVACIEAAIERASFSCPMSGQPDTVHVNMCVR